MESRAKYLRIMLLLVVSISFTSVDAMIKHAGKDAAKTYLDNALKPSIIESTEPESKIINWILKRKNLFPAEFMPAFIEVMGNQLKKDLSTGQLEKYKAVVTEIKNRYEEFSGGAPISDRWKKSLDQFLKIINISLVRSKPLSTPPSADTSHASKEKRKLSRNEAFRRRLPSAPPAPLEEDPVPSKEEVPLKKPTKPLPTSPKKKLAPEDVAQPKRKPPTPPKIEEDEGERLGQFQTLVDQFLVSGNQEVKGKLLQNVLDVSEKNPEILGKYIQRMITVAQDRLHILGNYEQLEQFKDNLSDVNDDLGQWFEFFSMEELIKETGKKYEAARAAQERATPPTKDLSTLLQQLQGKLTELNTQLSS